MGRETTCTCRVGREIVVVKALLESDSAILRGPLKRRWPLAALQSAIELHATLPCHLVWIVHPKGPAAVPTDAEVRAAMHQRGWRDSKTSAVSASLTATRYGKPSS